MSRRIVRFADALGVRELHVERLGENDLVHTRGVVQIDDSV